MSSDHENRRELNTIARVLLCLLVLLIGAAACFILIKMKKKAGTGGAQTQGTLVEVIEASSTTSQGTIEVMGTVIPVRELELKAEVAGRITAKHPRLAPGAVFDQAGTELCAIDRRDYQTALEQAQSQLIAARTALQLEEGRGAIARQEWNMLKEQDPDQSADEDLALRKPQLAQASSAVKAARSAVDRAALNLERTRVTLPFPAIVREETVEIGQLVSSQTLLARLAGTESFWVLCLVPSEHLTYLQTAGNGESGTRARVIQKPTEQVALSRDGRVVRILPDLDSTGRMARILVEVHDPLGMKDGSNSMERRLPLLLGSFVRVNINGPVFRDVIEIPRKALREGSQVWVMSAEDKLDFRPVKIAWRERERLLISEGIKPGDKVIVSRISGARPGMALRLADDQPDRDRQDSPEGDPPVPASPEAVDRSRHQ